MNLKQTVDEILKSKTRSLRWLAAEMDKTPDGLKLSLVRHSIKYVDIITMAKILEVPVGRFFESNTADAKITEQTAQGIDLKSEEADLKANLRTCRELIAALKDQIRDKDRIIALLDRN